MAKMNIAYDREQNVRSDRILQKLKNIRIW